MLERILKGRENPYFLQKDKIKDAIKEIENAFNEAAYSTTMGEWSFLPFSVVSCFVLHGWLTGELVQQHIIERERVKHSYR